jgi:hypothetical protein
MFPRAFFSPMLKIPEPTNDDDALQHVSHSGHEAVFKAPGKCTLLKNISKNDRLQFAPTFTTFYVGFFRSGSRKS